MEVLSGPFLVNQHICLPKRGAAVHLVDSLPRWTKSGFNCRLWGLVIQSESGNTTWFGESPIWTIPMRDSSIESTVRGNVRKGVGLTEYSSGLRYVLFPGVSRSLG